MTCSHETFTEPDAHGYSLCLDCSDLLHFMTPSYLFMILDWWDGLDYGDE